ncbi:hypothetical protein JWZ98_02115 [Methylomonas sp. EFPC1]|uniref:hypothetical protein n=1 Tax=Methylomonas sp. EFPC1 TaxID=2812647 RepID=UPI00196796CD|nr:hypothetical protein [Methylomonas sp. EFPC1]QSB01780.1 hypothetical protein JWZ98_02115 [Methylomonas sp. EFPC1]
MTFYIEATTSLKFSAADASPTSLHDCITPMCRRAESILPHVAGQFLDGAGKWNDEIIYYTLEAAINEIKDIREVINSYYEAPRKSDKPKPAVNPPSDIDQELYLAAKAEVEKILAEREAKPKKKKSKPI